MVENINLYHIQNKLENGWPYFALERYISEIPQIVDINVQRTFQHIDIYSFLGDNKDVEICDIQMQGENFKEHIRPTIFISYHYTFISTHSNMYLFYPSTDILVINFMEVGQRYRGGWLGYSEFKGSVLGCRNEYTCGMGSKTRL
jgi:hypothetical protein